MKFRRCYLSERRGLKVQFILIRIWFVAHCNLTFSVVVDFISGGAERTRQTSRQVRQVGYTHFLSAFLFSQGKSVGDAVALCLARWTPDRKDRVRALAGSLRCVLGRDTLYSASLHPAV